MTRTALVAGATGLIGQHLLRLLLDAPEYGEVLALSRRPLDPHHKLRCLPADYEALPPGLGADDVFCCLGTTLRKAGSKAAFEQVDYHYVMHLARTVRASGCQQFLVVSAAGTSARALSFYSRVKARMEQDVAALGFPALHILRPSLLLGERAESRPAERLGQIAAPLLAPLLPRKYRAIEGAAVAQAMLVLARRQQRGHHIHHLPLDAA